MVISQDIISRFMDKVTVLESGCWDFTSCIGKNGYARFKLFGRLRLAHRVAYELYVGEIPKGLQLHHTCACKSCVNPQHLKPVSPREHILFLSPNAPAFKHHHQTHCKRGHELSADNVYLDRQGNRTCKPCKHLDWERKAIIRGSRHRATLADILVVKDLLSRGISRRLVASLYRRSIGFVYNVYRGRTWSKVGMSDLLVESK